MSSHEPLTAAEAAACFRLVLPPGTGTNLVLAVSGGSDSMALLVLAARMRAQWPGFSCHVVTIDHGLRPEAAAEASAVARVCAALGLRHETLHWVTGPVHGNLSAAAREARYTLLGEAAWRHGATAVVTAHHLDDQVETHLLAAARGGQGPNLAGMRPARALRPGVLLLRPFLGIPAQRLKATVLQAGLAWHDDPTNHDMDYARARLRAALAAGAVDCAAALRGLALAQAQRAAQDGAVAEVLQTLLACGAVAVSPAGGIHLGVGRLASVSASVRRAILGRIVTAAGGALYPPPSGKTDRLFEALAGGANAATLNGARISRTPDGMWFGREYGREGIAPAPAGHEDLWFDRRFRIRSGSAVAGESLVALGCLGRGGPHTQGLPVLLRRDGTAIRRHADIAPWRGGPDAVLAAQETVRWRLCADLPLEH